jgi:hypothetical protein
MAKGTVAATTRTKAIPQRFTGKVTEWKGAFGWIQPSVPIKHPEAAKNKGRIYLSQEDVEADLSGVGATVSFFVYTDGKGLGAMNCRPGTGGGVGGVQKSNAVQEAVAKMKNSKFGSPAAPGPAAPRGTAGGKPPASAFGAAAAAKAKGDQGEVAKTWAKFGQKAMTTPTASSPDKKEKVLPQRIIGKVKEWKGKFGWVVPDVKVQHAEAAKHGGKIYLAHEDVEDEISGVGASVSFFVYSDGNGLGAMHARPAKAGTTTATANGGAKQLSATPKMAAKKLNAAPKMSAVSAARKLNAAPKMAPKTQQKTAPKATPKATPKAKLAVKASQFVKAKKQVEQKKEKGPSGPSLARERITSDFVTGEIVDWKRTFGWIKLSEAVEGVDAEKAEKIYCHKKDFAEGGSTDKGTSVIFHLYQDSSGLGAEECSAA